MGHGLRRNISAWKALLGKDHPSVKTIQQGHKIELIRTPKPERSVANLSDRDVQDMRVQVADMIDAGAVVRVPPSRNGDLHLNPVFLLRKTKADGSIKVRPVFDGRSSGLNAALRPPPAFALPLHNDVVTFVKAQCFCTVLDIASAYWHTPIASECSDLLGFKVGDEYFKFRALPFGLSSSGATHCRVLSSALQAICRRHHIQAIVYVDDILVGGASFTDAARARCIVFEQLSQLGWQFSAKTDPTPSTDFEYLGLEWSCARATVALSGQRLRGLRHELRRTAGKLQAHLSGTAKPSHLPIAALRRCVGKLMAARAVMHNVSWLIALPLRLLRTLLQRRRNEPYRQKQLHADMAATSSRATWEQAVMALSLTARHATEWNGKSITPPPLLARITSDASDTHCGATIQLTATGLQQARHHQSSPSTPQKDADAWRVRPPPLRPPASPTPHLDDTENEDELLHLPRLQVPDSTPAQMAWPVPSHLGTSTIAHKELHSATYSVLQWVYRLGLHDGAINSRCDSMVGLRYLNRPWGKTPGLEDLVASFHATLARRGLTYRSSFISSSANVLADKLSRPNSGALASARLTKGTLDLIEARLGLQPNQITVDLFASPFDHQRPRYASHTLGNGAVAYSAWQVDVEEEGTIYCFPPPRLISRCLLDILPRAQEGMVLLTPYYPRKPWWTLVLQHAKTAILLPADAVYIPGARQESATRWITWLLYPSNSSSAGSDQRPASRTTRPSRHRLSALTLRSGNDSKDIALLDSLSRFMHHHSSSESTSPAWREQQNLGLADQTPRSGLLRQPLTSSWETRTASASSHCPQPTDRS